MILRLSEDAIVNNRPWAALAPHPIILAGVASGYGSHNMTKAKSLLRVLHDRGTSTAAGPLMAALQQIGQMQEANQALGKFTPNFEVLPRVVLDAGGLQALVTGF